MLPNSGPEMTVMIVTMVMMESLLVVMMTTLRPPDLDFARGDNYDWRMIA